MEAYPKNLKTWETSSYMNDYSFITYPFSPKIKPILTVYANVSKLPSLLLGIYDSTGEKNQTSCADYYPEVTYIYSGI